MNDSKVKVKLGKPITAQDGKMKDVNNTVWISV